MQREQWTIAKGEEGERLDKLLATRFAPLSRSYFQNLIDSGHVRVNGRPLKKGQKPCEGDQMELQLLVQASSLAPEPLALEILYEDDALLAINKPRGMVVHPAPGHPEHTFANALIFHCQQRDLGGDPLRPGIVHRLDKDTSGVLLAAKHPAAHRALVHLFSTRAIEKRYLALCIGNPGDVEIDAPIARHPRHRQRMAVDALRGKEARSSCRVLMQCPPLCLVELTPWTGRTHQLRVHMQHHGTPILGDPTYGSKTANARFATTVQQLHAHTIRFIHPMTGQPIECRAPLPHDMQEGIKNHFHGIAPSGSIEAVEQLSAKDRL